MHGSTVTHEIQVEVLLLYYNYMCTRHPDLVSLDFHVIPIFHILAVL